MMIPFFEDTLPINGFYIAIYKNSGVGNHAAVLLDTHGRLFVLLCIGGGVDSFQGR